MKEVDPGHAYLPQTLDGEQCPMIVFVKREGPRYPGNSGHHSGTNLQETWRIGISRLNYLQQQEPCKENITIIRMLRDCIRLLEYRAAKRHNLEPPEELSMECIELAVACEFCGHIGHTEEFHAHIGH